MFPTESIRGTALRKIDRMHSLAVADENDLREHTSVGQSVGV
eukprot:COSAG03_NODE_15588_length_426_cov_1.214067_2_plen_41_part_01